LGRAANRVPDRDTDAATRAAGVVYEIEPKDYDLA
jgi:hypothetical protein